jgi:hypothetical protein
VSRASVFTMSSAGYLPGTLALIDSLRLTGFEGEVTVLDTGLEEHERTVLERRAAVRTLPGDPSIHAVLRKPRLHELGPQGVVIIVDSDMIVTRSLEEVVAQAESGKICLFPDHPSTGDRAFPVWETTFELSAPLRRRRHLNTGFVAFSVERWPDLLQRWDEACRRIPPEQVFVPVMHEPPQTRFSTRPFWGGDQDALNAILMSEIPEEAIAQQPEDEEIYPETMAEVEVVDEGTLQCRYRGASPLILHYVLSPKPWQRSSWARVRADAYVRLLRRLLADDPDTPAGLPRWLQPGARGETVLQALDLLNGGKLATENAARAGARALPGPVRGALLALRNLGTSVR